MQFSKSKTIASAVTLFLMLTIAITLVAVPLANAHDPPRNIPTFAYINVAPNPIGVGQQASVVFWLDNVYDEAAIANDYRFHNYKLTITAPDGDTETQTFEYVVDSTSSQYTLFTPTQAGTYTFDFTFPGHHCGKSWRRWATCGRHRQMVELLELHHTVSFGEGCLRICDGSRYGHFDKLLPLARTNSQKLVLT